MGKTILYAILNYFSVNLYPQEQYMIFEEASRLLLEEGRNALLEESLREEVKDE